MIEIHFTEEEDALKKQLEELVKEISQEIPVASLDEQRLILKDIKDLHLANQQIKDSGDNLNIAEWFEEVGNNMEEKAFRITLAVLNGAKYSSIIALSAKLLLVLMGQKNENTIPSSQSDPFTPTGSARLKYIEVSDVISPFGERVKVAKYKNSGYAYKILEYIWFEYSSPTFRQPFIQWLAEIAVDRQIDIRNRVAIAVGILAQLYFPEIREMILLEWAKKNDRIYRAAIGKVLGLAIWNNEIEKDILILLDNWGNSKNEGFYWAANRSYGYVGVRHPQKAFELAAQTAFHLAFVDIVLGDENGIRCAQRLKTISPEMRIVLISAYPDREFHRLGLEAGAAAFLDKKDLDVAALRQVIEDVI